jgi:hypothetical protein
LVNLLGFNWFCGVFGHCYSVQLEVAPLVISYNKIANAKWGKSVYYLFYDANEEFSNIEEVIEQIKSE